MGANAIQNFVIKPVKNFGENCVCCVKKYTFHSCLIIFACVLYKLFPSFFIVLVYSSPLVGFAFIVHRTFRRMEQRPKVKSVGPKIKRWKELQSRRSFKPLHRIHVPKQHNKSSFMQDPPCARQNVKETSNKIYNNMSTKDNKNKQPLLDEGYRKSSFDNEKDNTQESLNVHEEKEKQNEQRIKTVRWLDEAEKSLMDLGISEDDRTKRLETLMERRRSKKLSSFQDRKSGTGLGLGFGIGNTSCGQIPSLNIPKKNPFLSDSSSDPNTPSPVSAPSYMVKTNPFDLPYDPHEEKPILTGDSFEGDELKAKNHKEASRLGSFAPPEFTNYKQRTSFRGDFSIKQLPCGKLVTSTVANKEDDEKHCSKQNPNHGTNDNKVKTEENKEKVDEKSSQKVVDIPDESDRIEKNTKEKEIEIEHEISINESSSSSSSSCSEDERIRKPNKDAILHCLSMSRMRSMSREKSLHKHAETFDCGPSSLFDKSKTDGFYFGGNKKILYASTNSLASDLQVEVSEVGTPRSTSLHDRLNSFDMDLNNVTLSDVDDFSDQSSEESGFLRTDHGSDSYEKIEERD